jgi:hypothetical protein
MPRKPKPPPDDPEQSRRFIEAAREVETDESPEEFERVFRKIVHPKEKSITPTSGRRQRQKGQTAGKIGEGERGKKA